MEIHYISSINIFDISQTYSTTRLKIGVRQPCHSRPKPSHTAEPAIVLGSEISSSNFLHTFIHNRISSSQANPFFTNLVHLLSELSKNPREINVTHLCWFLETRTSNLTDLLKLCVKSLYPFTDL